VTKINVNYIECQFAQLSAMRPTEVSYY